MKKGAKPKPRKLKALLGALGVSQSEFARRAGFGIPAFIEIANGRHATVSDENQARILATLERLGVVVTDEIFDRVGTRRERTLAELQLVRTGARGVAARLEPGSPLETEVETMAHRMSKEVVEAFGFDRDPFTNELTSKHDVYRSRALEAAVFALEDAAAHQGFVALTGEIGSGKTTALKLALDRLAGEPEYEICRVRSVEAEAMSAYTIMEALVGDFSGQAPRQSREARARQVGTILEEMLRDKRRPVLVIDEAQALNAGSLRALKRLWDETEVGFRRAVAILIVGQNSNVNASYNLTKKLGSCDLAEVGERCQVVELAGLKGELGDYLKHKFKRAGQSKEVVAREAVEVLEGTYPLPLPAGNACARAFTLAYRTGAKKVTAEIMADAIKSRLE